MILSHKYRFIFLKTAKTAGTSLEVYLSPLCGEEDVLTPVGREKATKGHRERNFRGLFNPFAGVSTVTEFVKSCTHLFGQYLTPYSVHRQYCKFYNHIPARVLKGRVAAEVWKDYFIFCFERNPYDKTISHYFYLNAYYRRKGRSPLSFGQYMDNGVFPLNYPRYTDRKGNVLVDHIARYENLNEELTDIFGRLGVPYHGRLDVRAKSDTRKDRRHYSDFFNELPGGREYVERLNVVFEKEFEIMGYDRWTP